MVDIVTPDLPVYRDRRLSEFPAPGTSVLGAQAGQMYHDLTPADITRITELDNAERGRRVLSVPLDSEVPYENDLRFEPDSPLLDRDSATARLKEEGLDGQLEIPETGIRSRSLDLLVENRKEINRRNAIIARSPGGVALGAAGIATQLGVSLLDPVNIAASFVPVVGPARYAALLSRATTLGGRVAVRAGVGAAEGIVGTALLEPVRMAGARAYQEEYGLNDALANVTFGGLFGAALHNLAPAIRGASRLARGDDMTVKQAALSEALSAHLEGRQPRVSEVLAAVEQITARQRQADIRPGPSIIAREIGRDIATTATGRNVDVKYAIVEARDLIASQSDDGRINPSYPADLQPRDRSRAISEKQISDIARGLNPRLVDQSPRASDGAPIISPDGVVESGNGRVIAIRRAYGQSLKSAEEYRAYLRDRGYPVDGVENPVLVRIRDGALDQKQRQAFTREANERDNLGMSATERAMADASAMPDSVLELYRGGDVDSAANRQFVRRFNESVVGQNDQAGMLAASGEMSQEAVRRVQGALLAKAYGDSDLVAALIESADNNVKAIGGALLDVAPGWAQMRVRAENNSIDPAMDTTDHLLAAVKTVQTARKSGRNVAEYVNQTDIFSGDKMPELTEGYLRLFFRDRALSKPVGRDRISESLTHYLDEANKTSADPGLFGGAGKAEPIDIVGLAKNKQESRFGESQQDDGGFFGQAPGGNVAGVREIGESREGRIVGEISKGYEPRAAEAGAEGRLEDVLTRIRDDRVALAPDDAAALNEVKALAKGFDQPIRIEAQLSEIESFAAATDDLIALEREAGRVTPEMEAALKDGADQVRLAEQQGNGLKQAAFCVGRAV